MLSEELVAIEKWKLLFYCQPILFFFTNLGNFMISLYGPELWSEFFLSTLENFKKSLLKLYFLNVVDFLAILGESTLDNFN